MSARLSVRREDHFESLTDPRGGEPTYALVTIDAMGCQREIAEQIVEQSGDYVLAVKGNQPKLHAAISDFFSEQLQDDCRSVACRCHESHEKGHGRIDDRYYYLAKLP